MRSRHLVVLTATVACLAGGAVLLTAGDGEMLAVAPPVSSSTTSTSTTTTLPLRPANTTLVATARVPLLTVREQLPPGVERDEAYTIAANLLRAGFAPLSPGRPDAVEIPSVAQPVVGRRRTATGWELDNPTPFGNELTLVVTEEQGGWLKVQLPVRPNGSEGWIRSDDVNLSTHRFRVEVNRGTKSVRLFDDVTVIAETPVVVGAPGSQTPTGRFYVTDFDQRDGGGPYGPWVLALSAFSQDLDVFSDGAPLIALHGTNRPEKLGTAASNGCVRLPNELISRLRLTVPLGTPVDIVD